MYKKIIAVILVISMIFCVAPYDVLAEEVNASTVGTIIIDDPDAEKTDSEDINKDTADDKKDEEKKDEDEKDEEDKKEDEDKKEEDKEEEEDPSTCVRLVLSDISELPQSQNASYRELSRGTKERPFMILELVPDMSVASFGNLIGGCEVTKPAEGTANSESFLINTIGLSENDTKNYSVAIKTITADELNGNNAWIDYADLIVISAGSSNGFAGKDISADTALALYDKITADTDFAAAVIDKTVYNVSKGTVTYNVYDWNLTKTSTYTSRGNCGSNNMFKLLIMLSSMKREYFRALYRSGSNPVVRVENNNLINSLQSGDGKYQFSPVSLLFTKNREFYANDHEYWQSEYAYNVYGMDLNIYSRDSYTTDRVFVYGNGTGFVADYASSAETVKSLLTYDAETAIITKSKIKVLDIEPCADIDSSTYKAKYVLTESAVRTMLNGYTGEVEIVHETTANFNGKIEDINSEYQLIYIGTDMGAYNTSAQTISLSLVDYTINNASISLPNYNDDCIDGRIYTHTGDFVYSAEASFYYGSNGRRLTRSAKIVDGVNYPHDSQKGVELRFAGNDITYKMMNALQEYVDSGLPVVVGDYIYSLNSKIIDPQSYLYEFINKNKAEGKVLSTTDTYNTAKKVSEKTVNVVFTTTPVSYVGNTTGDATGNVTISHDTDLPRSGDYSYLEFGFNVDQGSYAYEIYVDQNRNSKFESSEKVYPLADNIAYANPGANSYSYRLSKSMFGSINWKIVVYNTANRNDRVSTSGCSVARFVPGVNSVKTVNILQIMPDNNCNLDLETSDLFKKYYTNLDAYGYKINMISTHWNTFEDAFKDNHYVYEINSAGEGVVKSSNPDQYVLRSSSGEYKLDTFDMLIIGFGDSFGNGDLRNRYGACYWIQHFIDSGKSVLFTHDTTSMQNLQEGTNNTDYDNNHITVYGSTANAILRDRLGMNRYGMISNQIEKVFGSSESEKNYMQYTNAGTRYEQMYDTGYSSTTASLAKQGFTYYAMRRLAKQYPRNRSDGCYSTGWNSNQKFLYKNLPLLGSETEQFSDANDETNMVSQLNKGQITSYPYKVTEEDGETFSVAKTHAQWYQLNLEDEDVTVWYTLTDAINGHTNKPDGLSFEVSPMDAANNYYIYSKGNLFYSGVGHSEVKGETEAKLFVNTMVAAIQASYDPPYIEITDPEVIKTTDDTYSLEILQEFNTDETGALIGDDLTGIYYDVSFVPVDLNLKTTVITSEITIGNHYIDDSYGGGKYASIYKVNADGSKTEIFADPSNHRFTIYNGQKYVLKYNEGFLKESPGDKTRQILFRVRNNLVDASSTTKVKMSIQPLFALD